ncbi:L,D-transpeptidase family protein [Vibrio parahaemolyticus]|uniref:L,D-transpeptidase family protein n=1 Tax=Vibrio parahaemolyticus TaxID=670 RepID=UPI00046FCE96|nr:L,D-transpeptidase family protein [Vibrio parahaemolyticus]EJG0764020.1 L,D-transpeptidase family protein [Vibrio parahaemolyticus O5:K30]EHK6028059.1 L,D-transpeptidase family protein [Vibrio parahaemolyticus]EIE9607522.1 L,D-transpeptidase family protein [Vibrio parahaemolyticus]EIO4097286.1 L,D-transpeptidase family protein [Vibrio parahaemolyticus]EIY9800581.1 L,D-transpeptidase family protein [Vibrio parahaemolyticus]
MLSKKRSMSFAKRTLLSVSLSLVSGLSFAKMYELPEDGSRLIGRIENHVVQEGETMANIAKHYDVGMLALMAANKGVDPFLPQEGRVLTIPSQLILPEVPHQGIVINLAELRLYYFPEGEDAVHVFPVGIGRIGRDTPVMTTSISQKRPNPTWTPPASIRAEYRAKGVDLPAVVPAGPDNPLGLFALRLAYGNGEYLIHGTNKDFGIGMRVSAGCIRMDPSDIEWLFDKVRRGEKVNIINQPVKVSLEPDRSVFVEAHEPLTRSNGEKDHLQVPKELGWWLNEFGLTNVKAKAVIAAQNGVPVEITAP